MVTDGREIELLVCLGLVGQVERDWDWRTQLGKKIGRKGDGKIDVLGE